ELQVNGPGEATMPAEQGTGDRGQGTAAQDRSPLTTHRSLSQMHIVWQQGLLFDGLTARFAGDVQARTATQTASAPILEATLTERLDFQAIGQARPHVGQAPG